MYNPLKVSLENIIPLTEARDHFSQIVTEVQKDKLYVLTKGGKPAVAIIDVKYLETLTGGELKEEHVAQEIKKAPEKVGLPPMVEHAAPKPFSPPPPKPEPPKPPQSISTPPIKQDVPKPAGFAAPQPSKPSSPPPENNPIPGPKPEENPSKPVAPPPPPSSSYNPSPSTGPSPLKTPPVGQAPNNSQGEKIDVQFSNDVGSSDKRLDGSSILSSPDDKTPPAQYAGSSEEPEDMSID